MKQRRMHPMAPGNNAYQRLRRWNLGPSMNSIGKLAAGGCTERVKIIKAIDAERAELRASHPGPKAQRAKTPIAAQPI